MTPQINSWYGGNYYYDEPEPELVPAIATEMESLPGWKTRPSGGTGLVLGRFLPLHRGHQYLIDLALAQVERLIVGVRCQADDVYSWSQRERWLARLFPQVARVALESTDLGEQFSSVTRVFSGEERDRRVAEQLGASFCLVDRRRIPISATQLRQDPLAHWEQLPGPVAADLVQLVRVVGAEGSGKSTLCQKLARHFHSQWVPEPAEELARLRGGRLHPGDLSIWAEQHLAAVEASRPQARGWLFLDTDLLTVALWGERMWGACPEWVRPLAAAQNYARTLVLSPRLERLSFEQKRERLELHRALCREIPAEKVLEGSWEQQWEAALEHLGRF